MRTVVALLGIAVAASVAVADFTVVRDGQPACVIVVPEDSALPVQRAGEELQGFIERSTGATVPVVSPDAAEGPAIELRVADWEDYPTKPLRRATDAYEIRVSSDAVVIEGPDAPCVLFGADDFLRRFAGVRWLAPGETWTVVPEHDSLTVPEGTYRDEAQVPIRALHTVGVAYHWNQDASEWMSRLRFNRKKMHVDRLWHTGKLLEPLGVRPLGGGHVMGFWLPNDEYFDEHPEYYGMNDGKRRKLGRGGTQICLSNEEVPGVFAERVNAYAADPTYEVMDTISIAMNDGWGFCTCPDCLAKYRRDLTQPQWLTDLVFGFSNEVARGVAEEHDDRIMMQLAYTNFYDGPPTIDVESNLMAEYCLWRRGFNRPVSDPNNEADAETREQTLGWAERADRLLIREYVGGVNLPDVRVLAEDLRWYMEIGADGWVTEIHPEKWLPRERTWVMANLLWNPEADIDALLADFFTSAYGPASQPMRAVYDLLEQALLDAPVPFAGKSRLAAPYLVPTDRWLAMLSHFGDARELAADDEGALARIDETVRDLQEMRNVARSLGDRQLLGQPPVEEDGQLTAYGERLLLEDNLVNNGSFELGPDSRGGWSPAAQRGAYELGITDEEALHGEYSAYMKCEEIGKSRWVYPHFEVDPEGVYEVNFWYMTTPDTYWTIRFGVSGGEGCDLQTWSTNTGGEWKHVRLPGLTPDSGKMALWLNNFATGTVYLDAVSVTRMDDPDD